MRPFGATFGASLTIAGLAATGCSAPVAGEVADANGAVTQGIVLVERSVTLGRVAPAASPAARDAASSAARDATPSTARDATPAAGDGAAPLTNVSAKFMRLSAGADPEIAERVIGAPLDLPALGACMIVSPARAGATTASLSSLGSVELLDAGNVTMRTGSTEMPLAARAFPDVGDLVFGVFYTSRDAASDLPAPARYLFESSGSSMLDRFSFEADAPAGPEDVRVGGTELADGIELDEGVNAVVQWRTGEGAASARPRDLVYVDVTSSRGTAVRCAFKDAGRGVIPGALLHASALGSLPTSATVAVHRVRRVAFNTSGMDLGEVRFDLSVIGRARVAPHY